MKLISIFILLFTSNACAYQGLDANSNSKPKQTLIFHVTEAIVKAACKGELEIIRRILKDPHFNVNAKSKDGRIALICAAENGRLDIVRELLKYPGINVNAKNNNGMTALRLAKKNKDKRMVDLLIAVRSKK